MITTIATSLLLFFIMTVSQKIMLNWISPRT